MRSHFLPTPFLPSQLLRDCSVLLECGCSLLNKGTKLGLNPCRICIMSCSCFPQQTPLCPWAVTPSNTLAEAALGSTQAQTLQKQAGKEGKSLCHAPGVTDRHTQPSQAPSPGAEGFGSGLKAQQSWKCINFFFSFYLKISSCLLCSFGQCQAFLVLCPPICSPGLQRGQGSGWGVMFIK